MPSQKRTHKNPKNKKDTTKVLPRTPPRALALLLAFMGSAGCVAMIQLITRNGLPPFFMLGFQVLYALVLYSKFKDMKISPQQNL